jgi:hypothetical protein
MNCEKPYRCISILLLALLAGCGGGPERTPLRAGTEHLLLLDGRKMRYLDQDNGKSSTYTLEMHWGGGKAFRVYQAVFDGLDRGHCTFISNGPKVFFTTDKPVTALQGLLEYRQLWVNEEAKQGEEWVDTDTGTKTLFAGFEDVTVPAGKYDNCYKTVTVVLPAFTDSLKVWREAGEITPEEYDEFLADANTTTVRWFASGVGLVKEQINGSDHTRELEDVVKAGTGKTSADTTSTE